MLAKQVRGLNAADALLQLQFSSKRKGRDMQAVLQNACNLADINCTTHSVEPEDLRVAQAYVTKGVTLKKISMHSKGRSGIKRRRWSHVTFEVEEIDWHVRLDEAQELGGMRGRRKVERAQRDMQAAAERRAGSGGGNGETETA
eukprot:g2051.t1